MTQRIDDLRVVSSETRRRRSFTIEAIAVLPDHLDCIWTLPAEDSDFSGRWHDIKARFSARIPHRERSSARRTRKGELA